MTEMAQMTVANLVQVLKQLPQDLPVVISVDEEGNQYKPVDEVEVGNRLYAVNEAFKRIMGGTDMSDEQLAALPQDVVVIWPAG